MAVLVAAVLMVAMMVPAWAATGRFPETKGTLSIENAKKGETYKAYQMLVLSSFTDDDSSDDNHAGDAYSYLLDSNATDSKWLTFFTTGYGKDFVTLSTDTVTIGAKSYYIVTGKTGVFSNAFSNTKTEEKMYDETDASEWTSASKVQRFAQEAIKYAKKNNITPTAQYTPNADTSNLTLTTNGEAASGTNTQLDLGYYVVDSTQGTLCSLNTLSPNVVVKDKNTLPEVVKSVQEDALATGATVGDMTTGYQKVNDAAIGDKVYYMSEITVEDGAEKYVLHDTMGKGLTFSGIGAADFNVYFVPAGATSTSDWINLTTAGTEGQVTLNGNKYKNGAATQADYYTVTTGTGGDTFTVTFDSRPETYMTSDTSVLDESFLTFLSDNMGTSPSNYKLVVAYSATVNEKAVSGSTGNKNETVLNYGESNTVKSATTTYTWPIYVRKYTTDNAGAAGIKNLAGAVFELYDKAAGADEPGTTQYGFVELLSTDPDYNSTYNTYPQYKIVPKLANPGSATPEYYNADGTKEGASSTNNAYVVNKYTANLDLGSGTVASHNYYTEITTTSAGYFIVNGLDDDIYYLKETRSPNGYNLLSYPVKIELTSDTAGNTGDTASLKKVEYTYGKTSGVYNDLGNGGMTQDAPVNIINSTTTELPSTGGMGTTVLYIVGGMLVILAGAYLFFSRKRTA